MKSAFCAIGGFILLMTAVIVFICCLACVAHGADVGFATKAYEELKKDYDQGKVPMIVVCGAPSCGACNILHHALDKTDIKYVYCDTSVDSILARAAYRSGPIPQIVLWFKNKPEIRKIGGNVADVRAMLAVPKNDMKPTPAAAPVPACPANCPCHKECSSGDNDAVIAVPEKKKSYKDSFKVECPDEAGQPAVVICPVNPACPDSTGEANAIVRIKTVKPADGRKPYTVTEIESISPCKCCARFTSDVFKSVGCLVPSKTDKAGEPIPYTGTCEKYTCTYRIPCKCKH